MDLTYHSWMSVSVAVGLGALVLAFHSRETYHDRRYRLCKVLAGDGPSVLSESESLRVEEELHEVRREMLMNWTRVGIHICVGLVLVCVMEFYRIQSLFTGCWLLLSLLSYGAYSLIIRGILRLTPRDLHRICASLNGIVLAAVLTDTFIGQDGLGRFGLCQGAQIILGLIFPPSRTTVFYSMCYTLAFTWSVMPSSVTPLFLIQQAFQAGVSVSLPFFIDAVLRDRIEASLRSKDSDSMIFGFRQMLKGICDGALLLDSSLQINGSAVCLQRLLSVREDLAGHCLEDFIDGEPAKDRFRSALTSEPESCVEGGNMDTEERAPPCLRVPFRAPSGRVVSADVCYVRLPNLYGAKSLHYLLSLTEDVDPRAIPEVEQLQTDQAPQERHFQHPGGHCTQARAEPASVASSESHVECYDELAEMTLLLNLSSELVDVEEAHLRFERHTNEVGFRMGMPTLKRFARPLEWRNIEAFLRHYAHQVTEGQVAAAEKQRVGRIMLRVPGESRKHLQAKDATISSPFERTSAQDPVYAFLHMQNFRGDRRARRRPPRLEGVDEVVAQGQQATH